MDASQVKEEKLGEWPILRAVCEGWEFVGRLAEACGSRWLSQQNAQSRRWESDLAIKSLPATRSPSLYLLAMPVHRRTNREIEVKVRVADVPEMLRKLENLGAHYESRVLERNTLYDTPDSDFRRRRALLRVRVETQAPRRGDLSSKRLRRLSAIGNHRVILTSKGPAAASSARNRRYKERLERELVASGSPAHWDRALRSLGLRPGFRYEKYRSTFRLPHLALELDETPAGTFLELEGLPRAIDRAARALGYGSRDYYRGSYWDVYVADCRRRGVTPRNMVFD